MDRRPHQGALGDRPPLERAFELVELERFIRVQRPMYIEGAYWACSVPMRSRTLGIRALTRSSSIWRASRARFSSGSVRIIPSAAMPAGSFKRVALRLRLRSPLASVEAGGAALGQCRRVERLAVSCGATAEGRCLVATERRGARPHRARDLDPDAAGRRS